MNALRLHCVSRGQVLLEHSHENSFLPASGRHRWREGRPPQRRCLCEPDSAAGPAQQPHSHRSKRYKVRDGLTHDAVQSGCCTAHHSCSEPGWQVSGPFQRVTHLFCELFTRFRSVGLAANGSLGLPLTQEELGDALGLSTVHVNRVLQALRADGLIALQSGKLTINDWESLQEAGEFKPNYLHLPRGAPAQPTV